MQPTVLVTGANGFVGTALAVELERRGYPVVRATRQGAGAGERATGEIGPDTDWSGVLTGVDVIIHTAARVHVMRDTTADPAAAFHRVNAAGTRRLADQAAQAGVRRLVFLSTIKVNGEATNNQRPFTAADTPAPADDYARSKRAAEQSLHEISTTTGLETTIIRPPLVYGPGAGGNVQRLLRLVERGVPLPLARVNNRRSFIALDNLVDLLIRCVDHPAAAGETFLAADGEDLSTPGLIRLMAAAMGRPARLFPMPVPGLRAAAAVVGRRHVAARLLDSLRIDTTHTRERLDWAPPVSPSDAMRRLTGQGGTAQPARGPAP